MNAISSKKALRIERLLMGCAPRELAVCSLLLGMLIVLADHRPAHLTRVHRALVSLPEVGQQRPGVSQPGRPARTY